MEEHMNLKDTIRTIPDFPKPGIMFRDITTLMTNSAAFAESVDRIAAAYKDKGVDNVAGIEARGFIFGAAIAHAMGAGFVPIRKKGKLPFKTYEQIMSWNMVQIRLRFTPIQFGAKRKSY